MIFPFANLLDSPPSPALWAVLIAASLLRVVGALPEPLGLAILIAGTVRFAIVLPQYRGSLQRRY